MPQNKPMKIQWITVNGRQVPLVLPQTYSYADDDWKVTSDQDPLPIVEYGTTAGGIVVPKRVSDEGHELTQLTGSIVGTEKIAENVTVTPGSNAIITQTYDISSYRRIGIDAYESSFTAHPWRLRAGNKNTGPFGIIEDDRHDREATQNSIMNRLSITSFDVTRPILRVEILNNDSVERSYDVIVIKMR